jgi:hypothetical protein
MIILTNPLSLEHMSNDYGYECLNWVNNMKTQNFHLSDIPNKFIKFKHKFPFPSSENGKKYLILKKKSEEVRMMEPF